MILFDIDGTLINSEGMGRKAVDRAFLQLYGHQNVSQTVSLAGRTDRELFHQLLVISGVFTAQSHYDHPEVDRAISHYLDCLESDLQTSPKGYLNPGVLKLLDRLKDADLGPIGILTGNVLRGARIKLNFFGIQDYFSFGAFGSDAVQRSSLFPIAARRREELIDRRTIAKNSVLIGDAPSDIHCARDNGAKIIAVATGPTSATELAALEPDLLVDDLTNTNLLFDFISSVVIQP